MMKAFLQRVNEMKHDFREPFQTSSQPIRRSIIRRPHRQKGMGVISWLFVIAIFGFVLTLGLKVFPWYLDNGTMVRVLDDMALEPGMGSKTTPQIDKILKQRFRMNNILVFDFKENVLLVRDGEGVTITLAYEERGKVIRNLDFVAAFSHTVKLRD
jgi:hypothetical protein